MYEDLTYIIKGCLFKVYNTMGNIWQEEIYETALESELQSQGLKAECQKEFDVFYFDKRVGSYRIDILVEDKIIIELKAVPKISPLHKAQLISYLKGYNKLLGILANFGDISFEHQMFPNKLTLKTSLRDEFDFDKAMTKGKEEIRDLLNVANRILVTLGPGYFHQVYRRAFYHELKSARTTFKIIKKIDAQYRNKTIGSREVNFFILGDMLLSAVAVKKLDDLILSKFSNYINHMNLKRGLIFNFNALHLDFRYFN